jgi:hypothetical protein
MRIRSRIRSWSCAKRGLILRQRSFQQAAHTLVLVLNLHVNEFEVWAGVRDTDRRGVGHTFQNFLKPS